MHSCPDANIDPKNSILVDLPGKGGGYSPIWPIWGCATG